MGFWVAFLIICIGLAIVNSLLIHGARMVASETFFILIDFDFFLGKTWTDHAWGHSDLGSVLSARATDPRDLLSQPWCSRRLRWRSCRYPCWLRPCCLLLHRHSVLQVSGHFTEDIREAPKKLASPLFGHCP